MSLDKFGRHISSYYYKRYLDKLLSLTASTSTSDPNIVGNIAPQLSLNDENFKKLYAYTNVILHFGAWNSKSSLLELNTGGYEYFIPFEHSQIVQIIFKNSSKLTILHNNNSITLPNIYKTTLKKGDSISIQSTSTYTVKSTPVFIVFKYPLFE